MIARTCWLTLVVGGLLSPVVTLECRGDEDVVTSAVSTYTSIVHAGYSDSLATINGLIGAIDTLINESSDTALREAKEKWIAARLPYLQTEVFRYYDGPIDGKNGPEGMINSWPMDEAYVDYVEGNPKAGIINDPENYPDLTPEVIAELNQRQGEQNVSCGFHAIEFLLWGQDQNPDGPGARPLSDFTTAKNADRRKAYLKSAAALLKSHLESLVEEWESDRNNYRQQFESDPGTAIMNMFQGMTTLCSLELWGERLVVAYESRAQEDEHSCFSDTTTNDLIYDIIGMQNVWRGSYIRTDGSRIEGTGLREVVRRIDRTAADRLDAGLEEALSLAKAIPPPFDRAIQGDDDSAGRKAVAALIDSLEQSANVMEALAKTRKFQLLMLD
ncbi:MAG: imelysin family protein [Verrucomicrobiales bacterium]